MMQTTEEIIARAWDAEESAQMGEPSPWSIPPDADWIADRIGCAAAVVAALDAAGFAIVPKADLTHRGGPELAQIRAMPYGRVFKVADIKGDDRKAVYNAAAYAERKGEIRKTGRGRYERTAGSRTKHGSGGGGSGSTRIVTIITDADGNARIVDDRR